MSDELVCSMCGLWRRSLSLHYSIVNDGVPIILCPSCLDKALSFHTPKLFYDMLHALIDVGFERMGGDHESE